MASLVRRTPFLLFVPAPADAAASSSDDDYAFHRFAENVRKRGSENFDWDDDDYDEEDVNLSGCVGGGFGGGCDGDQLKRQRTRQR
jgi:hypothetical protein